VDCATDSSSPLTEAIIHNNIEVASHLLANGADPKRTIEGNNALHLATSGGNEDMCALLLTLNDSVSLHVPNSAGLTPFDISVERGYLSLAETLHNLRSDDPSDQRESPMSSLKKEFKTYSVSIW